MPKWNGADFEVKCGVCTEWVQLSSALGRHTGTSFLQNKDTEILVHLPSELLDFASQPRELLGSVKFQGCAHYPRSMVMDATQFQHSMPCLHQIIQCIRIDKEYMPEILNLFQGLQI